MSRRYSFVLLIVSYLSALPISAKAISLFYSQAFNTNSPNHTLQGDTIHKKMYVALLTDLSENSDEIKALRETIESDRSIRLAIKTPEALLSGLINKRPGYQVIWIHSDDSIFIDRLAEMKKFTRWLDERVKTGTGLWLTHQACRIAVALGWEKEKPKTVIKNILDEGYGRMAGYHARLTHPIFDGLNNGCYVLKPKRDLQVNVTGYFGAKRPEKGKVVATDWDYIFLREDKKVIWEYTFPKSKALLIGGYLNYSEPNVNQEHLRRFTLNCLRYLGGDPCLNQKPAFYWDYDKPRISHLSSFTLPASPLTKIEEIEDERLPSPLWYEKQAENAYIQVSGSRIIAMGSEKAGIREIWTPPFMALRDYSISLSLPDTTFIFSDSGPAPLIRIEPGFIQRTWDLGSFTLQETLCAHPDSGVMALSYSYKGSSTARLNIRFRSNLRLMWPYSEKVNPEIKLGWDESGRVLGYTDETGRFAVAVGSLMTPLSREAGRDTLSEELAIKGSLSYELKPFDNLSLIVAAGNEGLARQLIRWAATARNVSVLNQLRIKRLQGFFNNHLIITTPDDKLNDAWKWLMAGVNSFYVETPGLANSLVAGHNTTGTGWDGGHRIDGRPGYAWYFGRDSEWSAMALLHYGDFEKVKRVLQTLADFQDLNGKIFHELTTTGFAHYDAADATPLFIVLAGRYLAHTGDTAFIRSLWPSLLRAYHFCLSTDTDHDHLIENTNVGHGWVEGGPLFGSHTSLYLASCWNEALQAMVPMAQMMNDTALARFCHQEAMLVNRIINEQFWNELRGHFNQGLMANGSWHTMPSIMPSVPALFGQIEDDKLQSFITLTAGNEYTTNYGSRILSRLSPEYRPNGYHSGSVWPLFTGWHALAAWKAGRMETALPLTWANLMIYNDWGFGYNEEVLNGNTYKPSGVCRHQCWSETMAMQPVVEGMLGYQPDALGKSLILKPNLPAQWDSLKINNLRCGEALLDVSMQKSEKRITWTFTPRLGSTTIHFRPVFRHGATLQKIYLNGRPVAYQTIPFGKDGAYPDISFTASGKTEIVMDYNPGFDVVFHNTDLQPGAAPEGLRIIQAVARQNVSEFLIEVELPAHATYDLQVIVPDESPYRVENAEMLSRIGKTVTLRVKAEPSDAPFVKKTILLTRGSR